MGGVYLDTDVMLHNSIDELLRYDCWMASDDVRYIATGLGFGAVAGNALIGTLCEAYSQYEYPSGTNVTRDTKIIESVIPKWNKSDCSQVLDYNTLFIGLKDYGKYAKHLYTYTWADDHTQQKRLEEISSNHKNKLNVKILWKVKCLLRQPKLIAYFDERRGTNIERMYTFCAYDLLDNGLWYFIKRLCLKIFKI